MDLILLLNLCFDCLLLYWTSLLLKKKVKLYRVFLGGLIGSLLIVLSFTSFYNLVNSVSVKIIVSLLMVWTTVGFSRLKTFTKACLFFYFVTFASGGILLGTHYLFSYHVVSLDNGLFYQVKSYGDPVSWLFIMIGFPASWIFSRKVFSGVETTNMLQESFADVSIKVKGSEFHCTGLIDTGNQLYEPFTNTPVMVLSVSAFASSIPDDVIALLAKPEGELLESAAACSWGERLRVIPYKAVGSAHQLLIAVRPDYIRISVQSRNGTVHKGLVALTLQELSHEKEYQCIVHPKMVAGLDKIPAS